MFYAYHYPASYYILSTPALSSWNYVQRMKKNKVSMHVVDIELYT